MRRWLQIRLGSVSRFAVSFPAAMAAFGLIFCFGPALSAEKVVLKLTIPASIRLLGADCQTTCWFSGLFAPAVVREKIGVVPVANTSSSTADLVATFVPTNSLAIAHLMSEQGEPHLKLIGDTGENLLGKAGSTISIKSGATTPLRLELGSKPLPAGHYTGQVQFTANAPNADPITQSATVEIRIRDSAVWALATVLLGIVLGRLAQLVYDPKVLARVQLLDWLNELEARVDNLQPTQQDVFRKQLETLKVQVLSRGIDPASLQSAFRDLESQVITAAGANPAPAGAGMAPPSAATPHYPKLAAARAVAGRALRILAGVTPLPLPSVYDWLLPIFVLLTLAALTVVFMLQQYGGTGTAEIFGAGGLADYSALFLAGVASEAIAGGLRAIKLR